MASQFWFAGFWSGPRVTNVVRGINIGLEADSEFAQGKTVRFRIKIPRFFILALAAPIVLPIPGTLVIHAISEKISRTNLPLNLDPLGSLLLSSYFLILLLALHQILGVEVTSKGIILNRIFSVDWQDILGARVKRIYKIKDGVL